MYIYIYISLNITSVNETPGSVFIDWGDGQISPGFITGQIGHTYDFNSRSYLIKISGKFTHIKFVSQPCHLTKIIQFGNCGLTGLYKSFKGCYRLTEVNSPSTDDLSQVTNAEYAFRSCENLITLITNLPNVTNFNYALDGCDNLKYQDQVTLINYNNYIDSNPVKLWFDDLLSYNSDTTTITNWDSMFYSKFFRINY